VADGLAPLVAISTYLAYALQHTDKRVQHITALGNMQDGQLRGLRPGDVMVAISFAPYAAETESIVADAHARGARIICITDSSLSPMARFAQTSILVNETSVFRIPCTDQHHGRRAKPVHGIGLPAGAAVRTHPSARKLSCARFCFSPPLTPRPHHEKSCSLRCRPYRPHPRRQPRRHARH